MQINHKNITRRVNAISKIKSVSFIELLIALSGGVILFLSAHHFYFQMNIEYQLNKEKRFLQQHSHQLLDLFKKHIQHIGYQGSERTASNFYLFQHNGKNYQLTGKNCLMFFADLNQDGCVGKIKSQKCVVNEMNTVGGEGFNEEIFGFKLENEEIKEFVGAKTYQKERCSFDFCQILLNNCEQSKWDKITEKEVYKVKKLIFELEKTRLMKIELELQSSRFPSVNYQATAYSYLLNGD